MPLPLFAATLAVVGTALVGFERVWRRNAVVAGTLAATIALSLHQVVDDLVFFPKVGVLWWLLLGIAAVHARRASRCDRSTSGIGLRR